MPAGVDPKRFAAWAAGPGGRMAGMEPGEATMFAAAVPSIAAAPKPARRPDYARFGATVRGGREGLGGLMESMMDLAITNKEMPREIGGHVARAMRSALRAQRQMNVYLDGKKVGEAIQGAQSREERSGDGTPPTAEGAGAG